MLYYIFVRGRFHAIDARIKLMTKLLNILKISHIII